MKLAIIVPTNTIGAWQVRFSGRQIGTLILTNNKYQLNAVVQGRLISAAIYRTENMNRVTFAIKSSSKNRRGYASIASAITALLHAHGIGAPIMLVAAQKRILNKARRGELLAFNSKVYGVVYKGAAHDVVCRLLDIGVLINPYAKRVRWQCVKLEIASEFA